MAMKLVQLISYTARMRGMKGKGGGGETVMNKIYMRYRKNWKRNELTSARKTFWMYVREDDDCLTEPKKINEEC